MSVQVMSVEGEKDKIRAMLEVFRNSSIKLPNMFHLEQIAGEPTRGVPGLSDKSQRFQL